jgi:hypothetical protein
MVDPARKEKTCVIPDRLLQRPHATQHTNKIWDVWVGHLRLPALLQHYRQGKKAQKKPCHPSYSS